MSFGERFLIISVLLNLTNTTTSVAIEGWPGPEGSNGWSATVRSSESPDEQIWTHLPDYY